MSIMNIDPEVKLDYSDVLLVPRHSSLSSRKDVDVTVEFFDHTVVPVIAANMDGVGTFEMAKELAKHNMMTALVKHYPVDALIDFYTENEKYSHLAIYSMGTGATDYQKWEKFLELMDRANIMLPAAVCIDVANGYTSQFEKFLTEFSDKYPEFILIAGNVVTPEQTEKLISQCGVDVVKIGVGPGSVCTTRKIAGVGYPQFSAVIECSVAASDAGGMIIADGGITCPGDAAKAFGAGADLVMLGGYLAGHQEGGGEIHQGKDGKNYLSFYGMASKVAQDIHNGGVAEYRASEGKSVEIPFKGKVSPTISELLGGIRSACTYIGAESINKMHLRSKFIRVNRQLNGVYGS